MFSNLAFKFMNCIRMLRMKLVSYDTRTTENKKMEMFLYQKKIAES